MSSTKTDAKFWRVTIRVTRKPYEFNRHLAGLEGSKREAIRHFRKALKAAFPNATLRLMSAKPDRQAEARAAKEASRATA